MLREQCRISVATPAQNPNPTNDVDWVFPDHEQGIVAAVEAGATCLWANTILFKDHPLQTSSALVPYQDKVRVVGQPPLFVDAYDDKNYVNSMLRQRGGFTLPKSSIVSQQDDLEASLARDNISSWPVVAKPIRGRGSHGVKLCSSLQELRDHADRLFSESPSIMIEEYLSGQEATVTVMPPSANRPDYWAMPAVARFNHVDGIAPYNGVVAVTANSRVISPKEASEDPAYEQLARECEATARLLQTKAPIRIDVRRFGDEKGSPFALFDVNMKPVRTPSKCQPRWLRADTLIEHDWTGKTRKRGSGKPYSLGCGWSWLGLSSAFGKHFAISLFPEGPPDSKASLLTRSSERSKSVAKNKFFNSSTS